MCEATQPRSVRLGGSCLIPAYLMTCCFISEAFICCIITQDELTFIANPGSI